MWLLCAALRRSTASTGHAQRCITATPILLLWQKLGRCLRPQAGQLLHSGHGTQPEPLQVLLLVPPPALRLLLLLHRRPQGGRPLVLIVPIRR